MMQQRSQYQNRDLGLFFLIAFLWSWVLWIPELLWGIRLYLGPFGPFVAAFLLTGLYEGKSGVVKLLKRGVDFGFKKVWLIPILLLFPVLQGLALLLSTLVGEPAPDLPLLRNPLFIPYWFVYMLFLGGPLQEEFGWRGYALDRLQARYSAGKASVILGIVWALWHLPLFFVKGMSIQYQVQNIIPSVVYITFLSILFTWIYNNTGGSVLATLLFHAVLNLSTYKLFPVFETRIGAGFSSMLTIVTAIVVLMVWGPKRLVRGSGREANSDE